MRCKYCHNPDTWATRIGMQMSAEEVMARFNKNREFYNNGGITVTGGEPLLQTDFLIELFMLAKSEGIHTCIDTSGVTFRKSNIEYTQKLDELMKYTDLVMLDIKHIDREEHKKLTGFYNDDILDFARYLDNKNIPLWIRHVIVPTITDKPEYQEQLGRFIAELSNVKALDVLPYHTMGISKYEELGIEYPLDGVPQADKETAAEARSVILDSFRKARKTK